MMLKSWIVAGAACVALGACEPGTGSKPLSASAPGDAAAAGLEGSDAAAPAATSVRLVDHDVEAPEVFQTSDKGLWDGRPSLGGVWVASADAKNPERVIMRNPANGKFVIGGLFQKDASLPGPKLQLSSDAADALGLVAGQPATVTVTALRREEAGTPAPDATKPLLDANLPVAGATAAGAKTDVAATAAAAIAKADPLAGKPAAGKPAAGKPAAGKPVTTAAAVPPVPPRPGAKAVVTASATPATPVAGAKPVAMAAAAPAAKPAAPAAPAASGALIQIGIFSVEANAKRAADILTKAGISSNTSAESNQGKPFWSVTARGNAALLAKIKAAGFKDAYTLSR